MPNFFPDPNFGVPWIGIPLPGWEKAGIFLSKTGGIDVRNKAGASVLGGGGSSVTPIFGAFPVGSLVTTTPISATRTPGVLIAYGGAQNDALKVYEITKAQYLANQSSLMTYLATLTPKLPLTLDSTLNASGSLSSGVTAGNLLAVVSNVSDGEVKLQEG